MKILKTLSASLMMLISLAGSAQITVGYMMETPSFGLSPQNTDKYQTLDTCYLNVSYLFKYRSSEKDDSLGYDDIMDLQMGRKYNAFFSRDLRALDIQNTEDMKTKMQMVSIPDSSVGFDLLLNHADSVLTETNRLPYTDQVIEYSEKFAMPQWNYVAGETDTVMGYQCKVATCNYGGRDWKVYYTDEIPLPYGPWKLNGAKGMILKAADTENNFIFEATGLTQKPQQIIRYDWNRKKMQKDEWRKFERDIYKNAGAFVKSTGVRILIADDSPKGFHRLNEEWSEFYNPLER